MSAQERKLRKLNRKLAKREYVDAGCIERSILAKRALLLKKHPELNGHWNC